MWILPRCKHGQIFFWQSSHTYISGFVSLMNIRTLSGLTLAPWIATARLFNHTRRSFHQRRAGFPVSDGRRVYPCCRAVQGNDGVADASNTSTGQYPVHDMTYWPDLVFATEFFQMPSRLLHCVVGTSLWTISKWAGMKKLFRPRFHYQLDSHLRHPVTYGRAWTHRLLWG